MKEVLKPGDIVKIISSGAGMCPSDAGKYGRIVDKSSIPDGEIIANNFGSYDVYWERINRNDHYTTLKDSYSFGRAGSHMFQLATPEEIAKLSPVKLETIKINGKPHLLRAIAVDLEELGYRFKELTIPEEGKCIAHIERMPSSYERSTKYNYQLLGYFSKSTSTATKTFILPEQYIEALEFAKKQLTFFDKSKILELGSKKQKVEIFPSGRVMVEGVEFPSINQLNSIMSKLEEPLGKIHAWNVKIADDAHTRLEIGCATFALSELRLIQTTYAELTK